MRNTPTHFDVCIFCALAEEVKAVIEIFSERCDADFADLQQDGRTYRYTTLANNSQESLNILVAWPPAYGPVETALFIQPVLKMFRPRFAAMTGICAGDRRKVKLGDLIIAERAFIYDSGKFVTDEHGQQHHQHDANPRHPDADTLQFVRLFDDWQDAVAELSRPPSKRQQRDWLLQTLLKPATPHIDDLEEADLEAHAPDWLQIMKELQKGPESYLTDKRRLRDRKQVTELRFSEAFPFQDPPVAKAHIAPMASGSAVRSDTPFDDVQIPVRGTVAVEMEGAAFYRAVAEFPGLSSLLVKGVCDYADPDKEDSYHQYAAQASAAYMLCLIQAYVTLERLPRPKDDQPTPPDSEPDGPSTAEGLGDELLKTLSRIPALQDSSARDHLLRGLPAGPATAIGRNSAPALDLENIVFAAEGWERLEVGERPLAVIARNALRLVQGTALGRELNSLLAVLEAD